MLADKLRKSVLQSAIQGKLTEQLATDDNVEDLLQAIEEEKELLIKEKKIKKQKPLPEIIEDEIPFAIPENWKWVRLGDISYKIVDGDHNPPTGEKEKTPYIMASSTNIGNERLINLEKVRYLSEENFIKCNKRTLVKKDDILFSSVGSIGSVIVYNEDYKLTFQRSVTVIGTRINSYYLRIVLLSPYCQFIFKTQSSGTAQKGFYIRQVNNLLIPLPPLAEQKRIVEKLDNVLANIDELKVNEEKLFILQKNFPDKLKKSILQSAIQGKLTKQLATDDKVEDLLQAIKEEKERLIKEKKIKKQKPLPEITEEEIPFTIPENWKWIRLGEIVSILGDGLHGTPIYDESGEYYFINGNNLLEEKIIIKSTTKKVSQIEYEKYKKNLNKDTMLVSINGTIGNVAFYDNEKVMLGKSVCYFNLLKNVNKKYLKYIFYSVYFIKYVNKMATGSTIKNLSLKAMNLFIIPLPPLAEQKRIVEKLDKLLADIEELKIE
ncbi:restriction endonuclease subunit S [Megamonas funiformis]|jgi:type I restriction enzyme S subunit|uniref:restriction endonuclease subunit S n=1 Tax=Megamonas funiformis TaxID=437897 RepID=UPI003521887A